MKRILTTALFLLCITASFGQKRLDSSLLQDSQKPVMMMFTASWCGPCAHMKAEVFPQTEVQRYLSCFNVVLVDIETLDGSMLQRSYAESEAVPSFVLLDKEGATLSRHTGALATASDFIRFLKTALPDEVEPPLNAKAGYIYVPDVFHKEWRALAGGGVALSNITGSSYRGHLASFYLEAAARWNFARRAALDMGVEYARQGGVWRPEEDETDIPEETERNYSTISAPVVLNVRVAGPVWVGAGLHGGVCTGPNPARFEFGGRLLLSAELGRFSLRAAYVKGFTNLIPNDIVHYQTNSSFRLGAAYIF